jgi:hypothetical protein
LIQTSIQQEKNKIKTKCNELKKYCSGFNLADELHIHIQQLEVEAQKLTSVDALNVARKYIKDLKNFVDLLSQKKSTLFSLSNIGS